MIVQVCSCGFAPDEFMELDDHFFEMFMPADGEGADGQVHCELDGRACSCGFRFDRTEELDAHFRAVFPPPASRIGRDGKKHSPVEITPGT